VKKVSATFTNVAQAVWPVHAWGSRENYFRDARASVDDDVAVGVLRVADIRIGMEPDDLLLRALKDADRKQAREVGNHVAVGVLEGEVCAVRTQTRKVGAGDEQQLTGLVASLRAEGLSASKKTMSHRLCSEFRPNFSDVLAKKAYAFLLRDRMTN